MNGPQIWVRRLRSRWRKWWRDPAAFVDDLPSGAARRAAVFGLAGGTVLGDLIDGAGRRAAAAWRAEDVKLRRSREGDADYSFLGADGREPSFWPSRVLVCADDGTSIVTAFAGRAGPAASAEVSASHPGVLSLGGKPEQLRAYRIDRPGPAPELFSAKPIGRAAQVTWMRAQGQTLAEALRGVWRPVERRPAEPAPRAYRAWIARNEPGPADLERLRATLAARPGLPRIVVLMPVHDPRPAHLRAAIASVRGQIGEAWSLCIADDGGRSAEVRRILEDAAADPRVRLTRLEAGAGVAAATNAALAMADADVALFLDHDDVLAPHALASVALALAERPDAAAVYSDEDVIDAEGRRSAPAFKPDLDRERLLAQNYVNHLFAVRTDLLRRLGGLREGLDGAQDHDLVLRVIEAGAGPILHLPQILYHWRVFPGGGSFSQAGKATADTARLKAVSEHLERTGRSGRPAPGPRGHLRLVRRPPDPAPRVLAIIPTRDRPGLLQACVAGLLEQTDYPSLDICIVDNGSETEAARDTLQRLARDPRVKVLRIEGPFNFSALNNAAAEATDAPLLAFINDDILVIEPGWLKALAALAVEPDVGAVGAKLFYPDGRIQHAGIVLGLGPHNVAGHEFRGAPGDSPGPQNRLLLNRETSAVTAACLVVETHKFRAVGGFDERAFPVAFNDVDLCLKLAGRGWRTVWTPQARLMHLESATRGADKDEARSRRLASEAGLMRERWGVLLAADPFYNPSLTLEDESFTLAERSRGRLPWP